MTTSALKPMSALTALLCVAAIVVLAPLWAPLVLAAWFADLLRPAVGQLERLLGRRRRAAGALIVLVAVGVLLPIAGVAAALVSGVRDLLDQVRAALEGQGSLGGALLSGGTGGEHTAVRDWADLASRYGANAWGALSAVARASASAAIGMLVFVAALYTFVVDGERAYAWIRDALADSAPAPGPTCRRLPRNRSRAHRRWRGNCARTGCSRDGGLRRDRNPTRHRPRAYHGGLRPRSVGGNGARLDSTGGRARRDRRVLAGRGRRRDGRRSA